MELIKDNLWNEIITILKHRTSIPTFKGEAEAEVVEITNEEITILLDKGDIRSIKRIHIEKAMDVLKQNGRVRQKDIPGNQRYTLGVMNLLPYFERERILDGDKYRWFLVLA